ncbi:MAG: gliding motility protein [Flavobacterium sp.]|nr:gliding motility protein [Flavobacterium sp.]
MKITIIKYTIAVGIAIIFVACSTKKNSFLSRNSHALSSKYNILYNGGVALDKGITDLKLQYKDNFWERLPVERMQISDSQLESNQTKNANFDRAEEKATKAIQKHSMNIDGGEKNPQMDEAHLMLGKARYYDQRFVPALEAFNYVLYKYPNSDKIYEVKIWREKTNMRMDNDALAITNLRKLLKEIKFKNQIFADANATLAQAFLNLKEKDSAVAKLKIAADFTKQNEEKARYRFILGQVYDELGYKDSAFAMYQKVIDMKRKSSRNYIIQAHAKQAQQFDFEKGDTIVFLKKFNKLLKDRENRPFLDVLNHQMGLFYDKSKKSKIAVFYYNKSLRANSLDQYLKASNYRNLASIYFDKAKYVTAGKYFDSTLVSLKPRTREFNLITKKRLNLEDVIKFEGIAQRNDSILKITSLSSLDRDKYYQEYIDFLKKDDDAKKKLAEKEAKLNASKADNGDFINKNDPKNLIQNNNQGDVLAKNPLSLQPPTNFSSAQTSTFYFYNPATIAYGKIEFKKNWGNRSYGENWRLSSKKTEDTTVKTDDSADNETTSGKNDAKKLEEKYTTEFYTKKLPTATKDLDSIAKERNFAYFQLGVIYKEKFKEYKRASDKLETLLANNPEERLVLPSMYNLYKIYEIIDKQKAAIMKLRITSLYPDSRYAQIINNPSLNNDVSTTPELAYDTLYKEFEKGNFRELLPKVEQALTQFAGDEIEPKFELLKANLTGKFKGLINYKKALNYVALSYPNSEEGKETEIFIATKIPYLESLNFNSEFPTSWNILYKADNLADKNIIVLLQKLEKFVKERTVNKLSISTDIYTFEKNFIVIHGIKEVDNAKGIAQVLKEFKEYKIAETAYVISSENYKVVQIKKIFDDYATNDWLNKPIIPVEHNITLPSADTTSKKGGVTKEDVKNAVNNVRSEVKPSSNTINNPNSPTNSQQAPPNKDSKNPMEMNDPAGSIMPPVMPKK